MDYIDTFFLAWSRHYSNSVFTPKHQPNIDDTLKLMPGLLFLFSSLISILIFKFFLRCYFFRTLGCTGKSVENAGSGLNAEATLSIGLSPLKMMLLQKMNNDDFNFLT